MLSCFMPARMSLSLSTFKLLRVLLLNSRKHCLSIAFTATSARTQGSSIVRTSAKAPLPKIGLVVHASSTQKLRYHFRLSSSPSAPLHLVVDQFVASRLAAFSRCIPRGSERLTPSLSWVEELYTGVSHVRARPKIKCFTSRSTMKRLQD